MKERLRNISLKIRLAVSLITVVCLMGIFSIIAVGKFSQRLITTYYTDTAEHLASTVAVGLNAQDIKNLKSRVLEIYENADAIVMSDEWGTDEFEEYTALYAEAEASPEFYRLRKAIRRYQDINDVDCIYLCVVDGVGEKVVYLVDGAYEDVCPPGCVDPLYDVNKELIHDPTVGFPPYMTDSVYGKIITAGVPVYYNNIAIAYAMVDVSMSEIKKEQWTFVLTLAFVMLLTMAGSAMLGMRIIKRYLAIPLEILSETARSYCQESTEVYHYNFENIVIESRDEIGSLLDSMQQMETDMNRNIEALLSTKTELKETKVKAEEMTDAAMKDPLTRVGSKVAYEKAVEKLSLEMMDPECRFGIVMIDLNHLKYINDNYGHEAGNEAIKGLSKIVCDVFDHSPVYRMGGDEFVVIVKGRDYRNAKGLVAELKERVKGRPDGKPSTEVIAAAVGYAKFKDIDSRYEDVFNRADANMYKNKEELHNIGREGEAL